MSIDADHIDAMVAKARAKVMGFVEQSERKFVESTVARGALTKEEALNVLDQERERVLHEVEDIMSKLRGWLQRGGTDLH